MRSLSGTRKQTETNSRENISKREFIQPARSVCFSTWGLQEFWHAILNLWLHTHIHIEVVKENRW